MPKLPPLPWPIRLAAFVVAAGMSLYVLKFYDLGSRLVAAVQSLSTSVARPPAPAPFSKNEPGVVPVNILPDSKRAK